MPKTMTLRLGDEQAEKLETLARVEGIPVSEAVRDAIDQRIEARRKDKAFQGRLKRMVEENARALELLAR